MGDWVWDGGRPSVDLLNTLRDRHLGGRETLHTPADLSVWLAEAGLTGYATDSNLAAARGLREAIDLALRDDNVPHGAIETINAAAAALPPRRLVLDDGGRPLYAPVERTVTAALARVAVDAMDLLTGDDLRRLRKCASETCGIVYVDRSPAGNRQWCSMRRCGNRTKAGRHYARRRDG